MILVRTERYILTFISPQLEVLKMGHSKKLRKCFTLFIHVASLGLSQQGVMR